jgi:acetylornithine/N-succinyldiaminopimelate aminotransferase
VSTTLSQAEEREAQYLFPTYARVPLLLERGKGVFLYDSNGKRYIDCITGIGVNALGYAHPRVLAVLREQGKKLIHSSNLFYNEYQGALAERLAKLSGMERAFFTVSGAEAVEGALKVARSLGQRTSPDKFEVVALTHSFHGRTMGALSVTGQPKYRAPFGPLLPGVSFVQANDAAGLASAVNARTCAIILEVVQGEGGVRELHREFLAAAAELARDNGACLICDEIQCGLGRTGRAFAYQGQGLQPDIVTTAKPIACGYPLGAILARGAAATALSAGTHGTTFGGGPLACRLALEFLDIVDQPAMYEHIRAVGAHMKEAMLRLARKHAIVKEVRGQGLMLGMELEKPAKPAVQRMLELGVIANVTHDTTIRMLPPYILEEKHADRALKALAKGIRAV